ncbi:hypothetical protein [Halobacterium sp. CBA1126]|uniref:hypothetical protein n=1 Tax=Halobacterium sp. CBA1126 TaxID=2668074 RepID=UPI0012F71C8F|nr:hypothetical protein [Halobacterium sp. CBA1126]MUV59804.1 hypothetical protein [Halobacterium sp. CBA1126]
MSDTDAASKHLVARVEELVEPEPDGVQNGNSKVWTSKRRLRADSNKPKFDFEKEDVETLLDELRERGEIVSWFGLVAPATDDHLEVLVENEAMADNPRPMLISQCNMLRQGGVEA